MQFHKHVSLTVLATLCGCAQPQADNMTATSARTIVVSPDDSKIDLGDGSEIGVDFDGLSQGQPIKQEVTGFRNDHGDRVIEIDRPAGKQ
jgi:hypothetical protein